VSNQVSHPYKTIRKIIVLYILIFTFLDSKLEDKIFYASIHWIQSVLNFFLNKILICYRCPQISELFHPLKNDYRSLYCDFVLHSDLGTWSYT
jgi:hypothetical protein